MERNVQHAAAPPWAAERAELQTVAAIATRHADPGAAPFAVAERTTLTLVAF